MRGTRASDSGAIPEVVGTAGLIVPEGDVNTLADQLHRVLFAEVRGCLVEKGLQRAREELSVEAMSQRLMDFYKRVLGNQVECLAEARPES